MQTSLPQSNNMYIRKLLSVWDILLEKTHRSSAQCVLQKRHLSHPKVSMNTKGVLADLASAVIRKQGCQVDHRKIISRDWTIALSNARPDLRCLALALQILSKEVPWQQATGTFRDLFSFTTLLAQSLRVRTVSETRLSETTIIP